MRACDTAPWDAASRSMTKRGTPMSSEGVCPLDIRICLPNTNTVCWYKDKRLRFILRFVDRRTNEQTDRWTDLKQFAAGHMIESIILSRSGSAYMLEEHLTEKITSRISYVLLACPRETINHVLENSIARVVYL